jgi:hypothetical protein
VTLTRYWIVFRTAEQATPLNFGCGVTASSLAEAISLVRNNVFVGVPMPDILSIKENISVGDLDKNHVVPNMGNPAVHGIWFPLGYEQ